MMNYTVKQLADKLEVTKATITNNAKALDLELKKIDNVIQIDDKQAVLISQRINKNKQANSMINKNSEDVSVSGSQTEEKDSRNDDLVEILKQQIEDLKKDKDEYINQVNNLNGLLKQQQTLLSQQQSLQLQSNEKINALEIELKEVQEDIKYQTKDVSFKDEDGRSHGDVENISQVEKFYRDLRNDTPDQKQKSFISRLFKR
ncbi:hypothetical protein [Macrococcoides caseolyticum]|uniref:hypothetical protein n=1 Tax=Macrococcoides caseolyticum TaxID=69966 RepID=UPI000C33E35E|nr:hypothetical protein [Macrococcus caseolyticus]PKE20679.1 hypothetical protein CW688_11250 [Macrococcus caseolyticus]PKF05011.1 hypothetical protein CW698_11145 [Macrococcus caseolyticus]